MSETPPAGYRKLPDGTRCRCIRLWQDGVGGFYCCRSSATLAFADSLSQHCPNCEAQAEEIEKLRMHLDVALETLAEEGVCGDECNSCKEARAALGETE